MYFAFPFALPQPQVRYQGATAWVNPVTDMLPGANRQWFATQGGVWAKGAGGAAAWATSDAPLVTLGDINRGLWPASLDLRDATLFSYVMNNYWYTDTPARQGGRFTFRYALTSGPDVSLADAIALSADQRAPLVAIRRYSMGWEPQLDAGGEQLRRRVAIRRPPADGAACSRMQVSVPDSRPERHTRRDPRADPPATRFGDTRLSRHRAR